MKDSETQIHSCSSFTKTRNFIELHWRFNSVVAELASLEKSSFIQLEQKGFYRTLPNILYRTSGSLL